MKKMFSLRRSLDYFHSYKSLDFFVILGSLSNCKNTQLDSKAWLPFKQIFKFTIDPNVKLKLDFILCIMS